MTGNSLKRNAGSPDAVIPEHLRAPNGISQQIHEINVLITTVLVEAQAEYQWLNRENPDLDAASRTSARLQRHTEQLIQLIGHAE